MNILTMFQETVIKYPDKVAIEDKKVQYTFFYINERAKLLAGTIRHLESGNRPIAVFANRDADTAILFLAVLYSGNFYVPLDPSMPALKINTILQDAEVNIVIGKEENRDILSGISYPFQFLTLQDTTAEPFSVDLSKTSDNTPLYMVYTSGSTGKPKGVLKSHGAMLSYIDAFINTFTFDGTDIIGNQTPFFFDASAKDFYLMLKTGATLEIIPTELFSFPMTLIQYMNEKRITFISWVPSALAIVTQLNTFTELLPLTLKRVFFVGEVFPMKHLNKWRKYLPSLQYVNLYGSSEIAGVCCYYDVKDDFDDTESLPMGKPLCNCEVFLMDQDKLITSIDVVGEVYVSSPALALEYYKDIDKTAASFIRMKTPSGAIKRVFKTGDLAKYDKDGNLIFAARIDNQIKHMGHRIELGEIESIVYSLPEIQRCCCIYNEKRMKITLFCELVKGCELTGRDIQSRLRGNLSDYMLPGKIIILDKLPLNANGKIDRQYLKELL